MSKFDWHIYKIRLGKLGVFFFQKYILNRTRSLLLAVVLCCWFAGLLGFVVGFCAWLCFGGSSVVGSVSPEF